MKFLWVAVWRAYLLRALEWALPMLPFFLPTYVVRFHVGPLPTTVLEVYVWVITILFLCSQGWSGVKEVWKRLAGWRWPMIAWMVVTLIAVWVSPSVFVGLGLWRAYILEPLLVLVVCVSTLRTLELHNRLGRCLSFTVFVLAGWALLQFITGWGIPHPWNVPILAGRRATGPFPFPNALSLFLVPIAAWAWAQALAPQARDRWLLLGTWFAALVTTALAKSEGGLFALIVVSVVVAMFTPRIRKVFGVGLVVAALFIGVIPPVRHKLWQEATFQGWSGQVRLFIWRETWQMLKDHPVWGAGFGGYPTIFRPYHKATAIEIFQYPHNILFNFWSETGLLGVGVFAWIVVTWFRQAWRQSRPSARRYLAAIAPLLALLIHGLVDVPYFKNDLAILFWLMLFVSVYADS